ncbi:unnamed protein product [Callosobruchus maculatus]|uniref:RRM domain-containing protein n=1 Tax=Callosobruchus maculatus TaxID=64391 RepID=A0A653DG04_CALMS|nr:unnamed protein product [Callosobruchus maculatus]
MLNVEKTQIINFNLRPEKLEIDYNNTTITTKETVTFLGVVLDERLDWCSHIDQVAIEMSKYCYALRVLRDTAGLSAALTAYQAYIQSRLLAKKNDKYRKLSRHLTNKYRSELKNVRKQNIDKKIENASNRSKCMWQMINNIQKRNDDKKITIVKDGMKIPDHIAAKEFSKQFTVASSNLNGIKDLPISNTTMCPNSLYLPSVSEDDVCSKLFVGGLSWETTQDNLQRYFSRYGEVIDCVVMKNAESGRSRGFGFVTFADPANVNVVTIDPKPCNPRTLQKPKKGGGYPKVFLGGLPSNVTETDLRSFFTRFGKVMEVVIMYDQEKKKSRGFGFLSFEDEDAVDRCVAEHFVNLNGKQVEIKKAEPRDGSGGNKMGGSDPSSAWGPPQAPMGMMQGPNGQMGGPPMNLGAPMGPNMMQVS